MFPSDSSVLSLSSLTLFLFVPALALDFAAPLPFAPLADPAALPDGVAEALRALVPDPPLRRPVFVGVAGNSIFSVVFMPINTFRRMSSYPGGVPVMPIEERDEEPLTPELMRFRIISVAAENCGTYLGGESDIGVSLLPLAAGGLDGPPDAIVLVLGSLSTLDWCLRRSLFKLHQKPMAIGIGSRG
jgi:hypothetical protein